MSLFDPPPKRQEIHYPPSAVDHAQQRNPLPSGSEASMGEEPVEDPVAPETKHMLSGFKQRLLSFMYHRLRSDDPVSVTPFTSRSSHSREQKSTALNDFYYNFSLHENLFFWKLQLLDRDHLLIKMGTADSTLLHSDSSQHVAFLVVYCISTTEIVDIFSNSDERLLKLYENHSNYWLLSPGGPSWMHSVSTASVRKYLQEQVHRTKRGSQGVISQASSSRPQSVVIRRVLSMLPASAQSYTPSPYIDANLFSYDEKAISAFTCERPKQ